MNDYLDSRIITYLLSLFNSTNDQAIDDYLNYEASTQLSD